MFTGLVEGTAEVVEVRTCGDGASLAVEAAALSEGVRVGESICISGACLTVTSIAGGRITADVSAETLARTTLGRLRRGQKVNIERALRLGDRLGGHIVLGHVDGVGTVLRQTKRGNSWTLTLSLPDGLHTWVVEKGSIAVDGVSLTVAALRGGEIDIAVIPHTATATTLAEARPGTHVNIEADVLGKYAAKQLGGAGEGVTEQLLAEHGFTAPDRTEGNQGSA